MKNTLSPKTLLMVAGAALLSASVPSFAQMADEEITVTGRYGKLPADAQSVSQAVSYADLDLSTKAGRDLMRHRVSLTARYLCEKLGESDSSSGPVPSCRDAATKDAMARLGTLEQGFAPRGTAWVAGTAWAPPYPTDWDTRYPY